MVGESLGRRAKAPKRTLASVITSQLRERIVAGEIPPGTQMNETELAARFSTSRGPIREGMQRLVQEGLLVSTPHRGIFVPVLTEDDLEDLFFARAALERAAILRLVDRGLPATVIARLEQALEEMQLALRDEDGPGVSAADLQFHEVIVAAANSPRLDQMYRSLAGQTRLGLNLLVHNDEASEHLYEEHSILLRALAAGDRARVMELLDQHFDDALTTLAAELDQGALHDHPAPGA